MRIENWNSHEIRFVEIGGEWWAVAKDVADALGLKQVTRALDSLPKDGVTISKVMDSLGRSQETNVINTKNIYRLAFKSRKKEAVDFQDWVFDVVEELRIKTELEGFQVFRMLDKEHQKAAMSKVKQIEQADKKTYIKANVIANKAISNKYGHPKMVKKEQMTPQMMVDRQPILDDTVQLMQTKDKFGLDVSVSDAIYRKWN